MKTSFLLIDNYDSFSYILVDYFVHAGVEITVIKNNDPQLLDPLYFNSFEGIVISPGPGSPDDSGYLMKSMHLYINKKPVLGVCLGHQAIAKHFGGNILTSTTPWHGIQHELIVKPHTMFEGIVNNITVGRYHSLYVTLPTNFESIATDGSGIIMAMAHLNLPVWGVQFHPESCMTNCGEKIISNFIRLINLNN